MAEAVAVLSAAANVLQFIDFVSGVVSGFRSFYRSGRQGTKGIPDLITINSDLRQVLKTLQAPTDDTNPGDASLIRLVQECQDVARKLEVVLGSLLRAEAGTVGKREALKAAFMLVWKEDEIRQLQGQLDHFRHQLVVHLLASLRDQSRKTLNQQQLVLEQLKAVHDNTLRLQGNIESLTESDGIGTVLLEFLVSKISVASRDTERSHLRRDLIAAILRNDQDADSTVPSPPSITSLQEEKLRAKFVGKLRYPGMEDRETRITETYKSTFEWIFEDNTPAQRTWSNFKAWLKSDSQLYWIAGKAGSGKSTLMKYICSAEVNSLATTDDSASSKRCIEYLGEWARGCRLLASFFFFWNSGVSLQASQAGLLRSLLVQILEQAPDLLPIVAPRRWEALCLFNEDARGWSDEELQRMLRLTAKNLDPRTKMCLFIDGLDEFHGDHSGLIQLLRDLVTVPAVKICVSSRPWNVFEDAFGHSPSLLLQDLTYLDMKHYVGSHFYNDSGFALLREREPSYADELVENVAEKASGVFLWVRLVVQSLLRGLGHGDRVSDLQRRLDFLPPELEKLYDSMLSSLDPFYLEHAAQLFKLLKESPSPPTLLQLALTDEENVCQFVLDRAVRTISPKEKRILFETMRRRLNSRCKGLLEVGTLPQSSGDAVNLVDQDKCKVQYLHRTVKDYVESPKVQTKLESVMKAPFDPFLSICAGNLAFLKTIEQETLHFREDDVFWIYVTQFMASAIQVSPRNHRQLIQLMDDLDKTSSILAKSVASPKHIDSSVRRSPRKQRLLEQGQWVAVHPLCDISHLFGGHFLSLAVCCGITAYVRERANKGCLVQVIKFRDLAGRKIATTIHSLLLDAFVDLGRTEFKRAGLDLSMVTCLLEKGANPNTELSLSNEQHSVWELVLAMIVEKTMFHAAKEWVEVARLMMKHGAGHYTQREQKVILDDIRSTTGEYSSSLDHRLLSPEFD